MAGPLAAAIPVITGLGSRFMASAVGKFLFGSTLRTALTSGTIGHMIGSRGAGASSQVQQFRS